MKVGESNLIQSDLYDHLSTYEPGVHLKEYDNQNKNENKKI